VALGPILFTIVLLLPLGTLSWEGQFVLATYAWVLAWWIGRPIPWTITSFLPLILFPAAGLMSFRATMVLYGQPVLPFLMGVMLFGYAFGKYGLTKRVAYAVLSVPGIATSGNRLILGIITSAAVLSMIVDDVAAVAIMIPIAVAVSKYAVQVTSEGGTTNADASPNFMAASALAVLYGASAGGLATPVGVPFNPVSIAILEEVTSYSISFAQWTMTGIVLMLATIPVYFGVLRFMLPPEVGAISGSQEYFREQNKQLGPLSVGERNVLIVLAIMVVLWFLPSIFTIDFLNIWYVPPVGILILFLLPNGGENCETTLSMADMKEAIHWDVIWLVVTATALASALAASGMTTWLGEIIEGQISAGFLPWFTGLITPLLSHLTSGTATTTLLSTILFPIAENLGVNPAVLARIIAGTALAVSLPWAGAAAAATFASGTVSFGTMFRVGAVATLCTMITITVVSVMVVPMFGAFSGP
jgi:sodium-dependent dicarboxylate transporter 2/3/5